MGKQPLAIYEKIFHFSICITAFNGFSDSFLQKRESVRR